MRFDVSDISYIHTPTCVFACVCGGNPQPEVIGHTQTCLQPEFGGSDMHRVQPRQLGNDSILNMVPISPLGA